MSPRQENLLTWGLVALCALLAGWNLYPRLTVQRAPLTVAAPDITVAIEGAVAAPGVYELPWGSSLRDLVAAAGGLEPEAERTLVNLAAPLDAGELVIIPTRHTATGELRLSLNGATLDELDGLPGVGPVLAGRIVAARLFASVEDLLAVSGIGPATLEKLRPLVKP